MERHIHTGNCQHAGPRLTDPGKLLRQIDMRNIRSSVRVVQKLRRKTAERVIDPVSGSKDQDTAVLHPVHDRRCLAAG